MRRVEMAKREGGLEEIFYFDSSPNWGIDRAILYE